MTGSTLYSIRMRAGRQGRHVSGAERICARASLHKLADQLIDRALGSGLSPDQVVVTIEPLDPDRVVFLPSLDLTAVACRDVAACRAAAMTMLARSGVSRTAALDAVRLLENGPSSSGGVMRGAMIMDRTTGERLEHDRERGVRASHFDWSDDAAAPAAAALASLGLTHFRTREALALATKVVRGPGVVAELCWSDNADYPAGYVASSACGYVRLPHLKTVGSPNGGRAIFVERQGFDLDALVRYLEEQPVLLSAAGACRAADSVEELSAATRTDANV